jgi:hypothetical protein
MAAKPPIMLLRTGPYFRAAVFLLTVALMAPELRAGDLQMRSDDVTAISAKTFNGYARAREPNGMLVPESYGVAVGGLIGKDSVADEQGALTITSDPSFERTTFAEIAGVVEQALATERYVPTADPKNAKLLIVIFWGRTVGTNKYAGGTGAVTDGGVRDLINYNNSKLLGFDSAGHLFDLGFNDPSNMMANIRRNLHGQYLDAIEDDRYLVMLEAFDFQKVWKHRNAVRLWETRFSLSERRHDFRKELPRMAQSAEHLFGKDSNGITFEQVREGDVTIGALKNLGPVPER